MPNSCDTDDASGRSSKIQKYLGQKCELGCGTGVAGIGIYSVLGRGPYYVSSVDTVLATDVLYGMAMIVSTIDGNGGDDYSDTRQRRLFVSYATILFAKTRTRGR
jgi:hypothetical protein